MASKRAQVDPKRTAISNAELNRLLGLVHGLVSHTISMSEGDLLIERLRIKQVALPSEKTEVVLAQIDEAMRSRGTAPVRFAESVLLPLIGTVALPSEQLKILLNVLDNAHWHSAEATYALCNSNAEAMEQLVGSDWSVLSDIVGVYRWTRSSALLERLVSEAEETLSGNRYQPEHYEQQTKEILSAIIDYPPAPLALRKALFRLLRASKPMHKGRDDIEGVVAKAGDVTLMLPLLVEFENDEIQYRNSFHNMSWLEDRVRSMRARQENLLASFASPASGSVRELYRILRASQALPPGNDHARLVLRREAVAHADIVLEHADSVLVEFVGEFSGSDEGQTDLVYVLCCLPKLRAISFLRDAIRRNDLTEIEHATLALGLSHVSGTRLHLGEEKQANAVHRAIKGRTWLNDENVEKQFHDACARATEYLGRIFESSPASHEERLTGMFLAKLQAELQQWGRGVEAWAATTFGRNSCVQCIYEDVAANGPEKVWGADVGFYLRIRANGLLSAERAFLMQAKKARLSANRREVSWSIDRLQRDVLIGQSSWSLFFLYGCHQTGTDVRVAPSLMVRDLMNGAKARSQVSAGNTLPSTCSFAEFFTYDFLASWWGDRDGRALDVVRGRVEDFPLRALFSIDINLGMVG
jgi:hypothetical protein